VAGEGWEEFFGRHDNFTWRSAQEYRQRFLIKALRGFVRTMG
jgi:hypothetical protein